MMKFWKWIAALAALMFFASPGCGEELNLDRMKFECSRDKDCVRGYVCAPTLESNTHICRRRASVEKDFNNFNFNTTTSTTTTTTTINAMSP